MLVCLNTCLTSVFSLIGAHNNNHLLITWYLYELELTFLCSLAISFCSLAMLYHRSLTSIATPVLSCSILKLVPLLLSLFLSPTLSLPPLSLSLSLSPNLSPITTRLVPLKLLFYSYRIFIRTQVFIQGSQYLF